MTDYRFTGTTIKLTHDDYEKWAERYHAIPDMEAELWKLDDYYTEHKVEKWFIRCSAALANSHQRWVLSRQDEKATATILMRTATEQEYRLWQHEQGNHAIADERALPEWTHRFGEYQVPEGWKPQGLRVIK